jgi:hypothetical protein
MKVIVVARSEDGEDAKTDQDKKEQKLLKGYI